MRREGGSEGGYILQHDRNARAADNKRGEGRGTADNAHQRATLVSGGRHFGKGGGGSFSPFSFIIQWLQHYKLSVYFPIAK